ncbi:MAG: class I SAM-dependent methyltransferase [Opitutaceae bacterium]|nr:class I SAM-dependent methyltransferase [Opitutaceae bacterium]
MIEAERISCLERKLEQAQSQLTDLQLTVAALNRHWAKPAEPQDVHFLDVALHLQLGVRYAMGCAVPGDIAEFGTMAGRTAAVIAAAMPQYDRFCPSNRQSLHLFDSFQGLPAASSEVDRASPHVQAGVWGAGTCLGISEEQLREICSRHLAPERIRTYSGWFAETLPKVPTGTRFAMLHIDCDLYQSTKDVLDYCFSQGLVTPGAAVFFDDWNCNTARPDLGERRAWMEAVADFKIMASDCGEYGMGCHKFIVHSYLSRAGSL